MKTDSWRERVVCNPKIRGGEPCIKGTRIPVALLVGSLADVSMAELLKEYPQLTKADLKAALRYAAEAAHHTLVA